MNYFRLANPFLIAHIVIWTTAVYLIFKLQKELDRLKKWSADRRSLTQPELLKFSHRWTQFDHYFELCSSSFILVGLIGTITGFFNAVPHFSDPVYDFRDFRGALAISGFGIVWSIVLSVALALLHEYRIAPLMQKVYEKVSVDELAQTLAHALDEFGGQITTQLQKALTDFTRGAARMDGAASGLSRACDAAAQSFSAATTQAAQAASSIGEILNRTASLPQQTIDGFNEACARFLASQQQQAKAQMDALGALVEQDKTSLQSELRAISSEYGRSVDELTKSHSELRNRRQVQLEADLTEARSQFAKALAGENGTLAAVLSSTIAELREFVREATHSVSSSYEVANNVKVQQTEFLQQVQHAFSIFSDSIAQQARDVHYVVESLSAALKQTRDQPAYPGAVPYDTRFAASSPGEVENPIFERINHREPSSAVPRPRGFWGLLGLGRRR
jgi:hypothetical protein